MGKALLVVSGEASGDNYAALLVEELKRIDPSLRVMGVGGENMRKAGAEVIEDYHRITVVGLTEVFAKLPAIHGLLKRLKGILSSGEVGAVVLIDFPDFNFMVGRRAKRVGIPVIYYIPPQMWAWREGRVRQLKWMADEVVVPFPFEQEYYGKRGLGVKYFGHPIMELLGPSLISDSSLRRVGEPNGGDLRIGLFPGSRDSEIERHLPVLVEAARIVSRKIPGSEFVIPVPSDEAGNKVKGMLESASAHGVGLKFHVLLKNPGDPFPEVDLAVASSGTITLELALVGIPTVVIYRVSPVTYIIGRMLVKIDKIALPNIVLGEKIFPELIQDDVTPEKVAGKLLEMLGDEDFYDRIRKGSERLRDMLKGVGPSKALAGLIAEKFL